jgi:hypothetical protein
MEWVTKRQLCVGRSESMTDSLFSKLLSLFPHLKFPVPMRREFSRKPPNFRLVTGVPTLQGPDFRQISLYFSLLQGIWRGDWFDMYCVASQPVSSNKHLVVIPRTNPPIGGYSDLAVFSVFQTRFVAGTPDRKSLMQMAIIPVFKRIWLENWFDVFANGA